MSNSFKNIKDRFDPSTQWANVEQDPEVLKREAAKNALNVAIVNKNAAAVAVAAKNNSIEDPKEVDAENEEMLDEDYVVPNLKLRKDIYGNFPVVLRSIPVGHDHIERYAIEWDRRNFYAMKQGSTSSDCYNNFGYYSAWRLIYALRKRADQYTVEPPRSKSELCVLAMRPAPPSESVIRSTRMFMLSRGVQIPPEPSEPAEARENNAVLERSIARQAAMLEAARGRAATTAPAPSHSPSPSPASTVVHRNVAPPVPAGTVHPTGGAGAPRSSSSSVGRAPVLRTLKDIMAHYPIVYKHDTVRNLYLIDIYGKKLKDDAERRAGRPLSPPELSAERRRVEHELHEALLASDAWKYYEPKGANRDHFAVLEMKHAYRG